MSNNMRTAEEKEKIVKEYLNGTSAIELKKKYRIAGKSIYKWIKWFKITNW